VALPFAAWAQGVPEIVIVEGARLPQAFDDLPAAASVVDVSPTGLRQLGLDEAIVSVPGVYFQNPLNFAQDLRVSVRGFGARANFGIRGVKIMLDDIPHTLPDGQSQIDSIDPGSIGQVEVLRGAFSALYGNASGGVINVKSMPPPDRPQLGTRFAAGDFGHRAWSVSAGGIYGQLASSIAGGAYRIDGYRDHGRAEQRSVNGRFDWSGGDGDRLTVVLNAIDAPVAQDPGALTAAEMAANPRQANPRNVLFDAGEALDQRKLGASFHHRLGPDSELLLRAYGFDRNFENRLPFAEGGTVLLDRSFYGGGIQYTTAANTVAFTHRFTIGLDVDMQDDQRTRLDNLAGVPGPVSLDQAERVTSTGAFAQDVIGFGERINVTLAARFDRIHFKIDDHFLVDGNDSGRHAYSEFSPSAGVSWRPGDSARIYGNIAKAFETPTTAEFANPAGGGFNPDLRPQTAINIEFGIKDTIGKRLHYDIALFRVRVTDEIVPFEQPESPGRSFFRNAGRSTRKGVEMSASTEVNRYLDLRLAYTWSNFRFDDFTTTDGRFDGNRLPAVPAYLFAAQLDLHRGDSWYASCTLQRIGPQYADDANATRVDPYWNIGLRGGIKRRAGPWEWEAFAGVNNVLDTLYPAGIRINAAAGRYFEPAPERSFYAGMNLRRFFGGG